MIHPYLQVPTAEHTKILRQRRNTRLDYKNRYGFQETIIHCTLTQLSMKRGINKFKKKGKNMVTAEIEQLQRRDAFQPVRTEYLTEKHKHELLDLIIFLKEILDG